jgi:hypothetical protein
VAGNEKEEEKYDSQAAVFKRALTDNAKAY